MTSAPDHFALCKQKAKAFLDSYEEPNTKELFKHLADAIKEVCEALLKNMEPDKGASGKGIKGIVQCRSKNYESLKTKLDDLTNTPNFVNWVAGVGHTGDKSGEPEKREQAIYEHPDMGDLAGVRIGLFFPDDVTTVAEEINKIFKVSYTFGTVTDTARSAANDKNQDIHRHGEGRWISRDPDGNIHHWEHYGYKSWQVVVECDKPSAESKPLPDKIQAIRAALARTNVFNPPRAEIQVGTVVTQAWAEVQHSIIYKNPERIQATPTMTRMIDAINGLAITTDIMLTELKRNQVKAQEEASKLRESDMVDLQSEFRTSCIVNDTMTLKRLLGYPDLNVNAKSDGKTMLDLASNLDLHGVVGQLLTRPDIEVNARDDDGMTALHYASLHGYHKVVEQLLTNGEIDVNLEDGNRCTALSYAVTCGHVEVVEQLLPRGAILGTWHDRPTLPDSTSAERNRRVKELLGKYIT